MTAVSRWKKIQTQARALFDEGNIFDFHDRTAPMFYRCVRFVVMVGKSFWRNRCPVRASALAYTTLLALVPLLAVGISISTAFLKGEKGEQQIAKIIDTLITKAAPQLDLVSKDETDQSGGKEKLIKSIRGYINNVSSGKLGAAAVIALVFVAISLLATIEAALNDIWGVPRGRSWFVRTPQYWTAITLGPILLLVVMGLNAGPYFDSTKRILDSAPFIGRFIYQLLPLLILIFIFALFYQLMPNTKVNWTAALVGGTVGALLWHLNNAFSVFFFGKQVARNSQIYGQLAIVPVFLIGIYFSWLIVLFGAQVAYAFQNRLAYIQARQTENVNQRGREFIALRLMTLIAQLFQRAEPPPTRGQLADALRVPGQLAAKIIEPLLKTNLLACVSSQGKTEDAYLPGRPLDQITYQDILDAVRTGVGSELPTREEASRAMVRAKFEEILAAERGVAGEMTLEKIVAKETGKRA